MANEDSDFDFAGELANMDDIQTGSALLPEDTYNFVVKAATTGVSSNGNPSINLQMEIIDGPYRGKSLIHNIYYSTAKQSGIEFFWRQLKTLGITSGMVRDNGWTQKTIAAKTVGAQLTAKIKHENYQDEDRARTQLSKLIVNPNLDGSGPTTDGVLDGGSGRSAARRCSRSSRPEATGFSPCASASASDASSS